MSENTNPSYKGKIYDLDEAARNKILLLDDDFAFADLTRMLLEQQGYEVELAADGVQGIKKIMDNDYAAILCDILMPNLAGDMFYKAVERVKPQLCRRFIFMTGLKGDRKIEEFIQKVRAMILWKPFRSDDLFQTLHAMEAKTAGAS